MIAAARGDASPQAAVDLRRISLWPGAPRRVGPQRLCAATAARGGGEGRFRNARATAVRGRCGMGSHEGGKGTGGLEGSCAVPPCPLAAALHALFEDADGAQAIARDAARVDQRVTERRPSIPFQCGQSGSDELKNCTHGCSSDAKPLQSQLTRRSKHWSGGLQPLSATPTVPFRPCSHNSPLSDAHYHLPRVLPRTSPLSKRSARAPSPSRRARPGRPSR